jgi:hypothetical protein
MFRVFRAFGGEIISSLGANVSKVKHEMNRDYQINLNRRLKYLK